MAAGWEVRVLRERGRPDGGVGLDLGVELSWIGLDSIDGSIKDLDSSVVFLLARQAGAVRGECVGVRVLGCGCRFLMVFVVIERSRERRRRRVLE